MKTNTHRAASAYSPYPFLPLYCCFVRDLMFANAHGIQPMSRAQQERINSQCEGLDASVNPFKGD